MDDDHVVLSNFSRRHPRCRLQAVSARSHPSVRVLRTAILRSVSRSFYLSVRCLPAQLREPVALAYLLARTTDTVADTAQISVAQRTETLQMLSNAIQGKASRKMIVDLLASFAPLQENPAERRLIESLPDSLEWLEQLEKADRDEIRVLLAKITNGQMLDLLRFNNPTEIPALRTAADLDEYTYFVAGCVGEFWTRLCFRRLREFASLSEDEMMALGKRYGMALQLINVLRDAGADLRAGRCYFPEDELSTAHLTPAQILSEPERFQRHQSSGRQRPFGRAPHQTIKLALGKLIERADARRKHRDAEHRVREQNIIDRPARAEDKTGRGCQHDQNCNARLSQFDVRRKPCSRVQRQRAFCARAGRQFDGRSFH